MTADAFLCVRDFLERIGLAAAPLAAEVHRAGFSGLNEEITTGGGYFRSAAHQERMRQLLLSIAPQILAIAQAEREKVRAYFGEVLPDFDRDRVYPTDIKKLILWYNLLTKNGITDFSVKEETETETKSVK